MYTAVLMWVDHSRGVNDSYAQAFGRSPLQGFGYGNVVHQFEKRCNGGFGLPLTRITRFFIKIIWV
ncbi:MAG: hypothetical protein F6K39_03575 [Okeania sp. SIO3B3]|nr:hypothetical protein [Okeania sp. SIO3B3]